MKTIKKAILILASVISLSVICGCKDGEYTREESPITVKLIYENKCYPIGRFEVSKDGTNRYYIIAREYNDIVNGRIYIYYNTTDDLKSASKLGTDFAKIDTEFLLKLSAETQNIGTYYFWGYVANYDPETHYELYADPRKSNVTPETFSYEFKNEIPCPENLKVKYSSETLNKIVVTWDSVKFNSYGGRYYLYTNTENDISSAEKVKHKKNTFSSDEQDYFDSYEKLIYEQVLLEDKPIYFWIKVYNNGYSDFSEPVFLDFKHKKPDNPTEFTVTRDSYNLNLIVKIEEAFPKPEYYKIYYAKIDNFAKAKLKAVQSNDFKYTDEEELGRYEFGSTEFEFGKTFYFWINAADTPDEDANPETESELVGPVSMTF
ncbi:hypothetical protein [Treponema sp. UBA753]|uniref:hypothetical protein n=1 Tax=Treponema sp. UBA753 TaxID=1947747 RepID=UPI0025E28595|nr:hypothetical protein [Treponema sp. UBA753]